MHVPQALVARFHSLRASLQMTKDRGLNGQLLKLPGPEESEDELFCSLMFTIFSCVHICYEHAEEKKAKDFMRPSLIFLPY